MTVARVDLVSHLHELLAVDRFRDYGPNGLQVEGRSEITRVVSGVTASRALIDAAIADGADTIVVHHGLFWRGQDGRVAGWMKQRLAALLRHDINLLAYHLPLDAHPRLGNNAQWGQRLGVAVGSTFGEQDLGVMGELAAPCELDVLAHRIELDLGRAPVTVPGDGRRIRHLAWCTGGAQGYFDAAIAAGADAFLTGEISEPQAHYARESGVAYLACGHHATERYGVAALGEHLAQQFGLPHRFIDIPNPA